MNVEMKIYTSSFAFICIIILFSLIILPNKLFSQETTGKEIKINIGAALNFSPVGGSRPFAIYLAPSFKNKRHEFYAGALMTVHSYFETFEPLIGGIGGYKFYIFKEPARVNMFAHYSFQYVHRTDYYGVYDSTGKLGPLNLKMENKNYCNTFGFGFNAYIDRGGRFSFYSTIGYCIISDWNNSWHHPQKGSTDFMWNYINISLGFSYRFAVLKKK
jgi:hypothetical protein